MRNIVTCRSCGARMFWGTTAANGKTIPIDADPVPDGNLFERDNTFVVFSLLEPPPEGTQLYKSHFATCPNAKTHRKKS